MSSSFRSIFDSGSKKPISEWTKQDEKLWMGVQKDSASVVQALLKRGVDPTKLRPNDELSSLHLAAKEGIQSMVFLIISQGHSVDLNSKDAKGRSPLHLAVSMGHHDIAQNLIENNADLTAQDVEEKSLMHFAVMGGHIGCVVLLINKGAPNNWPDKYGFTPLHYAAKKNQATICSLLIKNGASVNYKDKNGMTPLSFSALNGNSSLCTFLLGKGADKSIKDNDGHDALWHASKNHQTAVVKILDEAHCSLATDKGNAALKRTSTPLEDTTLDRSTEQHPKSLKQELTDQMDEITKSTNSFDVSFKHKDPESIKKNVEMIQDQIKKLKSTVTLSEDDWVNDEQTSRGDAFNRKFANSYRKLKNQVEFKDSDELVSCISETLLQLQNVYKENDELQEKVKDLEARLESQRGDSDPNGKFVNFDGASYTDVVVQKDILYEENKHLRRLLSEHISDLALLQKSKDNLYNHRSDPEHSRLVNDGSSKSIEVKALTNHVKSYIRLENQHKDSLAVIETLKDRLMKYSEENDDSEVDLSTFSTNEDWQKLTNSYNNKLLEDFNTLLESYGSLISENDALKESLETNRNSSTLLRSPSNNSIYYDTEKHISEFQTSENPTYSNIGSIHDENAYLQPKITKGPIGDYGQVVIQRDILQKEVDNLRKIITNMNTENNIKDESDYMNISEKNEIFVPGEKDRINDKQKSVELNNLEREIASLKIELSKQGQYNQEVVGLLQDHYIQYFASPKSHESSKVPSDLKVLVQQLTSNDEALMKALKEENDLNKELNDQVAMNKKKIASLESSLRSFGNMAVEKDLLESKVKHLEFIIEQNDSAKSALKEGPEEDNSSYYDCDTNEFIDKFISKNLFMFNDVRTKGPINACFDHIIKLENQKNDLIDEKERLLKLIKTDCEEVNDLKKTNGNIEKVQDETNLCVNDNMKRPVAPTIVLSKEEELFSEDVADRDQLGELFVKKDVIERELEFLEFIEFSDAEAKAAKEQELDSKLNEINNKINQVNGFLSVTDAKDDSLMPTSPNASETSFSEAINPALVARQFDQLVRQSKEQCNEVLSSAPPSEPEISEYESSPKIVDIGNKDIYFTNFLKQNNKYLQNQIDYLNRILEIQDAKNGLESPRADRSTDFSSFYTKGLTDKKRKKRKSQKDSKSQSFFDKLRNENDSLSKQLGQTHCKVNEVISDLKNQIKSQNSPESGVESGAGADNPPSLKDISEFVKNLEQLNEQQRKSLDEKEKEIQELNGFPDEYQKLFLKYNNLLQDYEALKRHSLNSAEDGKTEVKERSGKKPILEEDDSAFITILKRDLEELKADKADSESENAKLKEELDELKNKIHFFNYVTDQYELLEKETEDLKQQLEVLKKSTNHGKNQIESAKEFSKDGSKEGGNDSVVIEQNRNEALFSQRSPNGDKMVPVAPSNSPTSPCSSVKVSLVNIDREKTVPISLSPQDGWNRIQDMSQGNSHRSANNVKNGDEVVLDGSAEYQIEVLSNEILKLRECLNSTRAELNSYKTHENNDGGFEDIGYDSAPARDELATLKEVNRELEMQVVNLEYKMSERTKYERLGMNYELIETKKLLHAKMKDHAEKLSECEEKIEDYERELKHLKAKVRMLEMENESLGGQVRLYQNSRRVYNSTEDNDLIKKMRNENLKLRNFLEILQQTTQPCKHSATSSGADEDPVQENVEGKRVGRSVSVSKKHQHDECYKEINRLSKLLTETEMGCKVQINTYKQHLLSCFQGTMSEEAKERLVGLLTLENVQEPDVLSAVDK